MAQLNKAMSSIGDDPDNAVLDVTMQEIIKPPDPQDVENGQISDNSNEETEEEGCLTKMIPSCIKERIPMIIMLGAVGFGFWSNTFSVLMDIASDFWKGVELITGKELSFNSTLQKFETKEV